MERPDFSWIPSRWRASLPIRILQLLEQPELREEMGRKGRERVLERFTWQATADRWLELLKE